MFQNRYCLLCVFSIFCGTPLFAEHQPSALTGSPNSGLNVDVRCACSARADQRPISAFITFSDATIQAAGQLTQSPSPAPAGGSALRRYLPLIMAAAGGTIMAVAVSREEDFTALGRAMWIGIGAGTGALVGVLISRSHALAGV